MGNCQRRCRGSRSLRDDSAAVLLAVSTLGGDRPSARLRVHPALTVPQLKAQIERRVGVIAAEQRLVIGSEVLEDTGSHGVRALSSYGVRAGEELAVTLVKVPRRLALSGSEDGLLRLWDVTGGSLILEMRAQSKWVICLAVDWPSWRALSGSTGFVVIWNLVTGASIGSLSGHGGNVRCVALDWERRRGCSGGDDGSLILWDLKKESKIHRFQGHTQPVMCVDVDWGRRRALTGSHDRTVRLWDLDSGVSMGVVEDRGDFVRVISVDWDRNMFLSAGSRPGMNLRCFREPASGYLEEVREFNGHSRRVGCVSADWPTMAALSGSDDETLRLWDLESGETLRELRRHTDRVNCVVADWSSMQAVSGGGDSRLIWWNLETGEVLRDWDAHGDVVRCVALR